MMPRQKVIAGLCMAIFCVAAPFCREQLCAAAGFWADGRTSTAPFSAEGGLSNQLVAVALAAAELMTPIGLLTLATRNLDGPRRIQRVIDALTIFCMMGFIGSQMLLYNQFGGTLRHLEQTSMAIHSGTTFSFVSMFIIYRLFEARIVGSVHQSMFEMQLIVMCCGRVLYRVFYGLWLAIAGPTADGHWNQQALMSFGFFVLSLLLIYIGSNVFQGRLFILAIRSWINRVTTGWIVVFFIGSALIGVEEAIKPEVFTYINPWTFYIVPLLVYEVYLRLERSRTTQKMPQYAPALASLGGVMILDVGTCGYLAQMYMQ
jgi:hypothetical protein